MILLFFIGYFYLFFALYILVMGIYRAHLAGRLTGILLALCLPWVGIGFIVDVFANVFLATLLFLEFPKEWLFTTRLTRYHKYVGGYKYDAANFICQNLLDPFDPSGDHC